MLMHIIIKLLKINDIENNLKKQPEEETHEVQRNKDMNDERLLLRNNANQKTVEQHLESTENKFKTQSKIQYLEKIFKSEANYSFSNIKKLTEFITSRPVLHKMLKEVL